LGIEGEFLYTLELFDIYQGASFPNTIAQTDEAIRAAREGASFTCVISEEFAGFNK